MSDAPIPTARVISALTRRITGASRASAFSARHQAEFCGDMINPLSAGRLQPPHTVERCPAQQPARNQDGFNGSGGLGDLLEHQGGGGGDPFVVVWAVQLSVGS